MTTIGDEYISGDAYLASISGECIISWGKYYNVVIPKRPLVLGSLQIKERETRSSILGENRHQEAYEHLQRIIYVWGISGITNYLIYGREDRNATTVFSWEIVPYNGKKSAFKQQINVALKVIFWGCIIPEKQRAALQTRLEQDLKIAENRPKAVTSVTSSVADDIFCEAYSRSVVSRQRVLEGKLINVLYDRHPIGVGRKKLHFLLIPKQHRTYFVDLSVEEYTEVVSYSEKLILFYKKAFSIASMYDKNGKIAGQTVPHWHRHLVFSASKAHELIGKLAVLTKIFQCCTSKKRKQKEEVEYDRTVTALRHELMGALPHTHQAKDAS